jgi:hypothetical protein
MAMQVAFYKGDGGRLCGWVATPAGRRPFQGTTMAAGRHVPHDLAQFVVESTLGLHEGFWGLLANGASFRSVPGRRPTRPGLELAAAHRDALYATEGIVNAHVAAWLKGAPTPVGPALDAMLARWQALPEGAELRVEWPTRRLPHPARGRRRPARTRAPAPRPATPTR